MTYKIVMTFGLNVNNEDKLQDKIFDFSQDKNIKRTIQVQEKEEFDVSCAYYFGYVSYENISKQNLKILLKEIDETDSWLIYENNKTILDCDESAAKIEQWLNE